MADNFDANVARRKPNTSSSRPVHPWDVSLTPSADAPAESPLPSPVHKDVLEVEPAPVALPEPVVPAVAPAPFVVHSASRKVPASRRSADLSDSINIHSNFCKLDNDISDHLMQRLSASAQSVYLRLYRQSYGWNRNWAAESLPKLCEFCNLSLQTVRKAIKELETIGCIRKEFIDYHKATVYRIFLPSENSPANTTMSDINMAPNAPAAAGGGLLHGLSLSVQNSDDSSSPGQDRVGDDSRAPEYRFSGGGDTVSWGQNNFIQSIYFPATNIYAVLESGGQLPKNISKYTSETHLERAVAIIDEFYDSIGFSIVSRSLYRKSLLDFFDIIKSGFSPDDIRYAVRWTFKNSRSRPESFSLIKHTMHLAMSDLIAELKTVSGEADHAREKQEALDKNAEWHAVDTGKTVTPEDMATWIEVVADLKTILNEHSFSAFIEPIRLEGVEGEKVYLSAPPDSVSWVIDHYSDRIRESYCERTGKDIVVEVR